MSVLLLLAIVVIIPAIAGLCLANHMSGHLSRRPAFAIGAPIIYRREEASTHPTPDALEVRPAPRGEYYYFSIVTYLRVAEILSDGRIVAVARDKQRLCLWPNDAGLRKARVRERLLHWPRFPHF